MGEKPMEKQITIQAISLTSKGVKADNIWYNYSKKDNAEFLKHVKKGDTITIKGELDKKQYDSILLVKRPKEEKNNYEKGQAYGLACHLSNETIHHDPSTRTMNLEQFKRTYKQWVKNYYEWNEEIKEEI